MYLNFKKLKQFTNSKIGVAVMVIIAFFCNMFGKFIATKFSLPLWLDSFGTCLIAYMYGPVCGAIVGVALNVTYGIFDGISLIFGIVSILLGVACGIMARKRLFETIYGTFFAGFILSLIAIIASTPLKLILFDGYSQNIWNDGVFEMLLESGIPRWISSMLGQFAIDFIDKNIVTLLLFAVIQISRSKIAFNSERNLLPVVD